MNSVFRNMTLFMKILLHFLLNVQSEKKNQEYLTTKHLILGYYKYKFIRSLT
jgi:hypothetical protein